MAAGDAARFRLISVAHGATAMGFSTAFSARHTSSKVPLRPGGIKGPSHLVNVEEDVFASVVFHEASPIAQDTSASLVATMYNATGGSATATILNAVAGDHEFSSGEPGSFTQSFQQKQSAPAITYA